MQQEVESTEQRREHEQGGVMQQDKEREEQRRAEGEEKELSDADLPEEAVAKREEGS